MPPRPTTTARHKDLRDRLLAAAEATIATDGLASLRARSLADTVGCSLGAIYSVFPDLDALILQVNARTLADIDGTMRAAGAGASPREHLVRLATTYLDYALLHRHWWEALFQHTLPASPPDWYTEQRRIAFSHIEAPLALLRPALTEPDRALLARTLFAAVHGMVALGLTNLPPADLREQIRIVVDAISVGLSA